LRSRKRYVVEPPQRQLRDFLSSEEFRTGLRRIGTGNETTLQTLCAVPSTAFGVIITENKSNLGHFYAIGGTLRGDAPSYVEREADIRLYSSLREGEFCYVLTARQMGKSSLMVRTAGRLRADGTAVVVFDLTALGQNLGIEQWYMGLLDRVGEQLRLEAEVEDEWLKHHSLGPLQRWMTVLQKIVVRHSLDRS
jgi:AAA-like domain